MNLRLLYRCRRAGHWPNEKMDLLGTKMPPTTDHLEILDEGSLYSDNQVSSDEESSFKLKRSLENDGCSQNGGSVKSGKEVSFESLPNRKEHESFLRECVEILLKDAVFEGTSRRNKVVEFKSPEKLQELFDFALKPEASNHQELTKLVRDVIKHSVKVGHPYFVNQLFSSIDPYGLIGQWLTDALNPSIYTYEVSPLLILMEARVLQEMRSVVGWKDGKGDGIFNPGGSMSNAIAINLARFHKFPKIKETGLHCLPRLVVYTSEDAHYSVKKMAAFMGLGTDNVCLIDTDDRGKMKVDHLVEQVEYALKQDAIPFLVSATSGTTVIGAFDPLEPIADVCEKYGMWLHVDAAWGGGALMSRKHRGLMKGIERSDSVTWNLHKLLTAPQQCSVLLTKHEKILTEAHSANASYLFQKDKFYDTKYDTGDKHIQCGRRADVLKFWFMWKAKGTMGFEKHVDKLYENSQVFLETIKNRPGFELVIPEPECTNVCFWYIPESLRNCKRDTGFWEKLHKVAPKMKERMMKEGTMMVTYNTYKDKVNFFRMVLQNSGLDKNDMIHLVEEIERLGKDL